jgi:hypothetical protein
MSGYSAALKTELMLPLGYCVSAKYSHSSPPFSRCWFFVVAPPTG